MPLVTIPEEFSPPTADSPSDLNAKPLSACEQYLLERTARITNRVVVDERRLPPVSAKYLEEEYNKPVSKEELMMSSKKIDRALKRMQRNR